MRPPTATAHVWTKVRQVADVQIDISHGYTFHRDGKPCKAGTCPAKEGK